MELRTFIAHILATAFTALGVLLSPSAQAGTYTVTTTNDAGAGSLRTAITSANGAAGADTIRFNIAGAGVRTITLVSALPTITGTVFIDGYTQSGTLWNTTDPGSNAVLRIELNGNNTVATGLTVNANGCTIQGLILNRFTTNSINVQSGTSGTRIVGNFIGTNPTGTAASGTGNGVLIAGSDCSIGDWGAENRNLFSGATANAGLVFSGAGATNNYVRVNQFGLSANGTTVIGGLQQGIRFENGANWNQIGETGCCYNRITGATGAGIAMIGATTDNNNVSGNYTWGNGGLGIDLGNDGVTTNDVGDGDSGPNQGQNYPVIQAAMTDQDGRVYVRITFTGLASTSYRFDYYANTNPDGSGYGEGQLWIGTRYANTDGSGNLVLHATAGGWNNIPAGTMISCTATQDGTWNTSEFAQNVACYYGRPIVTNTSDVVNGNTTSIMHLVATPGADGISLREAIMAANNNLDAWTGNYIYFDLPGAGPQTITPTSPLPSLQTSTYLGGWTDPEFSGTPVVRINGSSAGAGANGLVCDYGWCGLYAMSITNFNGNGIQMNSNNNEVMGCHIGVMPDGSTCAGNGGAGVFINNTESNSIGNPWWGDQPSVIAGNAGGGVVIDGANAAYNFVRHAMIGVNVAGTAAICSQPAGVVLQNGAHDNTIGTDQLAKRNVISGHFYDGIRLDHANDNIVITNYVGTNLAGTGALPNTRAGLYVANSDGNDIGAAGMGNLVSGNAEDAIFLHTNSSGNTIAANTVGLSSDGLTMLANGAEGISLVSGASNNIVGGSSSGERNLIAGNTGWGIHIGGGAQGNTVSGNYIGLNSAGIARTNQNGIVIENGQNNTIGPDNVISGNTYHGVYVMETGSTGNVITANRIGTNPAGTAAVPNGERGVLLRDGSNNTVGGSSAAAGNVISGNGGHGIFLLGLAPTANANIIRYNRIGTNASGTNGLANIHGIYITGLVSNTSITDNQISGNTGHGIVLDGTDVSGTSVRGNRIGTNAGGSGALANTQHGIWIGNSAHHNTIGGTNVADRNVIGGNGESGVNLQDLAASNTIIGNYIGITADGASDLGNAHRGIHLRAGTTGTVIGGTAAGAGNVISGNDIHGIALEGTTTATIQGNLIGTNAAGSARIGNNNAGIFLQTNGVTIGGNTAAHRNVISGNNAYGIYIETSYSQGGNNSIIGNYIGTDITGAVDLGNTFNGILMGGSGNRIGGSAAGEGNVISGNDDIGLRLESATNTTVLGNILGLNAAGTAALGNLVGISLKFASNNNTIGGTTAAARNIISGNGGAGLIIDGSNTNTVQGNYIGTNSAGTQDRGNGSDGIRVLSAASTNTIGGTAVGTGNVISGNGNHGILLNGSAATTVRGNIIGLRAAGDAAIGNDHDGIAIIASNNNIIGGSATGSGNVISGNVNPGNSADGIYVDSGSGNAIQGNLIGTDVTGTLAFGNYYAGISNIANGTIIGGTNTGEGNTIRNNGSFGVRNQGTGVRILGNAIDANGGIGIDHNSDGVSVNDLNDIDGGANSRQNFPVLTSATSSGGNSSITGTLNSTASSNYRIEFFSSPAADPSGYGEGATFLGSVQPVSTNASGNATINANLAGITIPAGHYVTATATNLATNNTSEFSGARVSGFTISGVVFEDVNYGGGAGRDLATATSAGGTGRSNARVELYDGAGAFLTSTLTNASGQYSFTSLASGDHQVRVVNSTVSSARTGYATSHRAVQTYMATSDNNVVYPITDHVGGIDPAKVDAGNGSTTIAALQSASTEAQSLTWVNVDSQDLSGIDFGFSFNVVCNTNDAGQGSLRQFITQANALSNTGLAQQGRPAGIDNAVFMISNGTAAAGLRAGNNYFTSGVATITPTSALPVITSPVVIDAQTQPGFTASPVIEIRGTSAGDNPCFNVNGTGGGSIFRGLIVNRFNREGIYTSGNNVTVQGNWIGLDRTGALDQGNGINGWSAGISLDSDGNTVGGTTAFQRNVISGDNAYGIWLGGANNTISGNYIGLNASGTAAIPNSFQGIIISSASNNTIGGTAAGAGNVISGNGNDGIIFNGTSTGNALLGNIIGLNAAGTAAVPNGDDGVDIESDGNTIGDGTAAGRNVISGNSDDGIILDGADNCAIRGNHIGTDPAGTAALANGGDGIQLSNSASGTTIGGLSAGYGNLISRNAQNGILIGASTGTQVLGNRIGTNAGGTGALGNQLNGIRLNGAATSTTISGNVISGNVQNGIITNPAPAFVNDLLINGNIVGLNAAGSTAVSNGIDGIVLLNANNVIIGTNGDGVNDANEGNIISGNMDDGIEPNLNCTGVRIAGNHIGTDITGMLDRGNGQIGIHPVGGGVIIGTNADGVSDALERNIISGNGNCGISMIGNSATNNVVAGNWVGLNSAGTGALGNTQGGVRCMLGASNNRIGTDANGVNDAAERNVICANGWNGVEIFSGSSGNTVAGNYIGLRPDGITAQGNTADGVHINASPNTIVGGTTTAARNVIAGNGENGIEITGAASTGSQVLGNHIGTNAVGTAALGNTLAGVRVLFGANNTIIGGAVAGARNVISANHEGVYIDQTTTGTTIKGNHIGTDADATAALGNTGAGVLVTNGSTGTTIGGAAAGERNVISGNGDVGINVLNASNGTVIKGNFIGTDATGSSSIANLSAIAIGDAANNVVGGSAAGEGNVLSGNNNLGVQIAGVTATGNVVQGNYIGVQADGTTALGNANNGVLLASSATNNAIGGVNAGEGNLIANHGFCGIRVDATAGNDNVFSSNAIHSNDQLGIDLKFDGVTANDANDADSGPNRLQNFPVLNTVGVVAGTATINGTLNSLPSKRYRVEFFANTTADPSGYGEGQRYLGAITVNTDASGNASFSTAFSGVAAGEGISSTATEDDTTLGLLHTSEFSNTKTTGVPPTAVCQNITVNLNAGGSATITGAMIDGGSTDDGIIVSLSASPNAFTCSDVGANTVTLTVTDDMGLTATCTATVTVVDASAPVIAGCPSNIPVNAGAACTATASWPVPTVSDNCAGATISQTAGLAPGSTFPIGTTTITYTATDASGNTSTCSFTVTVADLTAPVITGCPSNITVNAGASCNATATWTPPSFTDNCAGGSIVRTTGPASGSTFSLGVTNIAYTATDAAGNTSACAFTVTVVDATPPTYALCPGNQTINAAPGLCTALLPGPTFGYADNCSGTTNAQVSGTSISAPMPVGVHPVSFRLTDAAGNLSVGTCNFTVTVVDNQAPTALCQNVTVNLDGSGTAIVTAAQVNNGSTDNCAVTGLSVSPNSFTAVGTYPVVLTVTDAAGNTSTCNATVTVTDVNPPVAVCQNITIPLDASGNAGIVAADIDGGSTDNGAIVSMVASQTAFDCSALGTNNVTLTVTDDGGNTDDCVAVVTVVDNIAPTATCQNITIQLSAGGTASITAVQIDGGSSDNCTVASLSASQTNFDCTDLGANTVTLTVTDQSGNQSTCNATVTVVDNILPQITCPANITVNNDAGICGAVVNYVAPVGTDNCAGSTTTRTTGLASGSLFPVGTTTVTYLVTDASGNTANCSFNVTVNDNEAPTLNCPANITVNVDAGSCGAVVNYPAPTANDNCGNATISRTAGPASGATFPFGTTVVAYEITHGGQTSSCFFTVTVVDNIAPTATCQNITIQLSAGGTASITAAQIDGGSTDNCTVASLSASQTNFDCTDLGANTVTLTVTDQSGNQSTCDATVTVVDNILPQITCPANITVNNDVNQCGAVVNYTAPVGTDNCAGSTTTRTAGLASGSLFPIGTTTVTYQETDGSGNMANCSFTVTVNDTQNPAISCPANIVVGNDANQCGAVVNYVAPADTDNCPGATTARTAGLASGSLFPLGLTTVTYQVTDASGNTAQCSFTVTVNDTEAPSITCPANVSAFTNAGCTATGVALGTPTTSDNCGVASVTNDAPAAFPLGSTSVTWTVTDNAGNTNTCTQTVMVTDNVDPVAVCQNISINLDGSGNASFVAADVDGGSTDNCAVTGLSVSPAGPFTAVGTYNVTLTVTDAAGNTDDCVAVVTVTDNNPPVAVCQNITIQLDASGNASIVAADIDGGSTDNGTIVSMVASQTAFDCSDLGTNNVTLTVTDDGGNTDDCIAVVTVVDGIDPSITCPADVNANTNSGCTATGVVLGTPTTADNCSVASVTNDAPAAFPIGTTVVTWTVTDNSGNNATCTQNVTVTDASAPVIVACPGNLSLTASAACTAVATWTAPTVNDNCNGATITQTAGPVSGSAFPLGTSTITYTATDASGNTSTCSFTVTVLDVMVPDVVDCPNNISLNAGATCTAVATWIAPTVTDNCSGATITQTAGPVSGSAFPLGTSTITYTATDASGNTSTCSFTVTVLDATVPVVVDCPSNISLNAGAACTAVASWVAPTVADNCSGATITQTAGLASGSAFPLGTSTITYTATDGAGNMATCSFTVTVTDVTAPAIACPANIVVGANAGICGAVVNYTTPVGTDNCSGAVTTMTAGLSSGSTFPVGTTTVTYLVTDAAGLTASCSFTVTVNDTEAPVAVCQNISINLDGAGNASFVAADVDGGSTDNCAVTGLSVSPAGPFTAVGTYNVTLTVTDAAGNTDDCVAMVTVTDNNPPVALCQPVTIYLDASGNASVVAADIDGGSTDNGIIVSLVASQTAFDCSDLGTNNVTLTVTDDGGNTDDCVAVMTVLDTIAPTVVCQNIAAFLDASGNVTITGADLDGGSSDNCGTGSLSFTSSVASFSCAELGPQTVTLTVEDASGNVSTCSATVTVQDTITPTIACSAASINIDGNGWAIISANAIATWSDNCSSGLSAFTSTDSVNVVGDTTIWVYVQDITGNIDSCSATVTVTDNNPPVAVCQDVTIYLDASGNASIVAADIDGGSTDNGIIVSLVASQTAFDCSNLGANNVTLTVTDDGGNTDDCIAVVTVLDTIAPALVCQNIDAFLDASGNVTITGADLDGGSSDNCGTGSLTFSASTASFDCSNLGQQTVTLTVTDASGNSSVCNSTVTVQDTITPMIACSAATINIDGNGWAIITSSSIATWSDNCSSGITTWVSSDSVNVVGDTTIWVYVQDITGNIDSCSAMVTVTDNNPPVAVCQDVTIYLDGSGNASIVAADIDGGSTDNGTIASLIASQTSFDCSNLGANNVTLTVTDDGGNSDDCVAVVNVLDTIAPTLSCQSATIMLQEDGQAFVDADSLIASVADNCTGIVLSTDVQVLDHAGSYAVTVTATDASGNQVTCASMLTVVDTIAPEANCLAFGGLLVYLDQTGTATIEPSQLDGGSFDNDTIMELSASQTVFDCSDIGLNPDTLFVTDASGNTMWCTAGVTVLDTIAPTAVCTPITLAIDSTGTAVIEAIDIDGGSSDNCSALSYSTDVTTFDTLGTQTVTLTVTDGSGNVASCSASVMVIDDLAPVVACGPDTVYLNASGVANITVDDVDDGSSDNLAIDTMFLSQAIFTCDDLGPNDVVLTVGDASGNTDSCIAIVTVLDTIAPSVVCQDITLSLGTDGQVTLIASQLDGGSTDNCGGLILSTSTTTFQSAGSYSVTLTVTDPSGNSASCTATVTVIDQDAPTAICQPITIYLDAYGHASIIAADIDGGSTDAGSIVGVEAGQTDFGCGDLGANNVTLTVTDDQGNSASCTAIVTVLDTISPDAVCSDLEIAIGPDGLAVLDPSALNGGSADNCDSLTYEADITSWSSAGTYQVTLTLTDASGNSSTCTAMITVTGNDDPLIIPSGFSPNGDGVADTWTLQGIPDGAVVNASIFNRWGQEVYASGDYHNDWRGTCERGLGGNELPDGTYFYVLDITGTMEKNMNGYLQIAR